KKRRNAEINRREFLHYGQAAALAFLPSGLAWPLSLSEKWAQASSRPAEFHVHPKYRTPRALEAVLKKVAAENDIFPSEVQQDRTAALLQAWSADLLESRQKADGLGRALSGDFSATSLSGSLKPRGKNEGALQVWEVQFDPRPELRRESF